MGDYIGECYRDFKGDTRSLDYSSCLTSTQTIQDLTFFCCTI